MATQTGLQDDLRIRLETSAKNTVQRVASLCRADGRIADELREKFADAVNDIAAVRIEELSSAAGSFLVQRGTLKISEGPISRLLYEVIDDIAGRLGTNPEEPMVDLPAVLDDVVAGFVLHELRHRTQGIEKFGLVNAVRLAGGPISMSDLDALADRDAAFALAALKTEGASRAEFLAAFEEALFLSSAYYFKVFPISAARPDKIARALGVLLMLARLAAAKCSDDDEDASLPLDAPLLVHLATNMKSLVLYRGEPSRKLLAACNDEDCIADLVADVDAGRLDSAIERGVVLLRAMNLV